jgi:hypothetical protein
VRACVCLCAVVEGYDVVKKIEDCGTNSGKPKEGVCVCLCVCVSVFLCVCANGMDPPSDVLLYVEFCFSCVSCVTRVSACKTL